nr:hypothetical protein [Tanacetum cinerariifolium]
MLGGLTTKGIASIATLSSFGFDQTQPPQSPVIHQPPQELSIQEIEDLKQQYFDEMKRLINSEYRDEIKIEELKGNFNSMSIEINKREKLLQLEKLANLSTYPSKHEHIDTIPATESDEVLKSSVENLILIPSESEDIIVLSSYCEDINEGASKGKVPKEDINKGPSEGKLPPLGSSTRPRPGVGPELAKLFKFGPPPALLRWYGYDGVDEYLEDTFFDSPEKETKDKSSMDTFPCSTDKETSDTESADKNISVGTTGKNILSYKDTIKKYVPVVKSASKKSIYKSFQPITRVVLGLANLKTWDDIVQKMRKRPPGNSADKGKGKAKDLKASGWRLRERNRETRMSETQRIIHERSFLGQPSQELRDPFEEHGE